DRTSNPVVAHHAPVRHPHSGAGVAVNADSSPGTDATRLASSPGADATGLASTLVACLTPPGRGAIASLGIRGPSAWEIVRELFCSSTASMKLPENPDLSRIWLGRMGENSTIADQVVVTVQQTTRVPWVEIHCH